VLDGYTINATIGGGNGNRISSSVGIEVYNGTIAGGGGNLIDYNANHATISGGQSESSRGAVGRGDCLRRRQQLRLRRRTWGSHWWGERNYVDANSTDA